MLLMTGRLHLPAAEVYSGGGGDAEECREQMRCRWSGSLAEAWTAGSIVERAVAALGRSWSVLTAPLHEKRPTMEWSGDGQQLMPMFAATLWHRYVSMEHVGTGIGRVGVHPDARFGSKSCSLRGGEQSATL